MEYRTIDLPMREMEESMNIVELVDHMAKALVDKPDKVSVHELKGQNTSVIELRVAKEDVGKVIGKKGRNADALRTIVGAAAMKERKTYVLEIID
jgi:predicted RNA-binding protein YlqC (UPF0109 family)